eukprot:g3102.t1
MASPVGGTSSRGRRLSPKEPDKSFVYPTMSPRQNSGGMRDARKRKRGGGTGEEESPIEVLDSSLDQTPRHQRTPRQEQEEGRSSDEDGGGDEGSGVSSYDDEDGEDSTLPRSTKAAKRREGTFLLETKREWSRVGEIERMCLLAAKYAPEQHHGAEASKCWLKLAEEFLKPADMEIERNGERMTVRVDFEKGRPPVDLEEFSKSMRRKFGRVRAKMKAEDEEAQKKTGEGTETAEEHDDDQGNSEVAAIRHAVAVNDAAHETRVGRATISKKDQKKGRDQRAACTGKGKSKAKDNAAKTSRSAGTRATGGRSAGPTRRGAADTGRGGGAAGGRSRRDDSTTRRPGENYQGVSGAWYASADDAWAMKDTPEDDPASDKEGSSSNDDDDDAYRDDADKVARDDAEATALSRGEVGRAQKDGRDGKTRRQRFKGDPTNNQGQLTDSLASLAQSAVNSLKANQSRTVTDVEARAQIHTLNTNMTQGFSRLESLILGAQAAPAAGAAAQPSAPPPMWGAWGAAVGGAAHPVPGYGVGGVAPGGAGMGATAAAWGGVGAGGGPAVGVAGAGAAAPASVQAGGVPGHAAGHAAGAGGSGVGAAGVPPVPGGVGVGGAGGGGHGGARGFATGARGAAANPTGAGRPAGQPAGHAAGARVAATDGAGNRFKKAVPWDINEKTQTTSRRKLLRRQESQWAGCTSVDGAVGLGMRPRIATLTGALRETATFALTAPPPQAVLDGRHSRTFPLMTGSQRRVMTTMVGGDEPGGGMIKGPPPVPPESAGAGVTPERDRAMQPMAPGRPLRPPDPG